MWGGQRWVMPWVGACLFIHKWFPRLYSRWLQRQRYNAERLVQNSKWMWRRLIRERMSRSVSECVLLCVELHRESVCVCMSEVSDELPCIWVESHPSPSSLTLGSCRYMFPFVYTVNGHLSLPNLLSHCWSLPKFNFLYFFPKLSNHTADKKALGLRGLCFSKWINPWL